jgi:hypothetical protein
MPVKKRYSAAIYGQGGMFSALKRAWASRFYSIRAIVMVAENNERLELLVTHNINTQEDHVSLKRRNWHTGAESILYDGSLTNGQHKKTRNLKD